jgi:RES domain-containing protein
VASAVTLYRIASDTARYHADDLSGAGAKHEGGRWNSPGVAVCYASTTIALAALETLVHLTAGLSLPLNRILVEICVPDRVWDAREQFDAAVATAVGWNVSPPGLVSLGWGDRWVAQNRSCLACVPSVIVPEEQNVLFNPTHPDATLITATKVRVWSYDPRIT